MEDDEEYCYKSYSADTEEAAADGYAAYREDDEVYAYSGYADGGEAEEERRFTSYGDFIIEEFSAANNVSRVAKLTKLSADKAAYGVAAVYFIVGVLCVSMTAQITQILPYVVGGVMAIVGLVRFIIAMVRHEYRHLKTNQTATSLIFTALGIMIILQQFDESNDSAIMLISVVWGILGLFEGAHAFNHAFKRIANSERCAYYLIKGLIECAVAFMLLYQPDSHDVHHFHIIVFGVNLIFDAVTMLPQVKRFLAMK